MLIVVNYLSFKIPKIESNKFRILLFEIEINQHSVIGPMHMKGDGTVALNRPWRWFIRR